MTGACTIEGVDISTLGVLIVRGGDHDLISFPQRKEPVLIDWPDEDGFEISDDDPVFDAKNITIKYYLKGDETTFLTRFDTFTNLHFQTSTPLSVYVREFDLTFTLRFVGISNLSINRGISTTGEKSAIIDIDYVMDDPLANVIEEQDTPTITRDYLTYVELNTVDLADFGIIVKSVYPAALKSAVKPGIIFNSRYSNGQTVTFPSENKKQTAEIAVSCAMVCADRDEFMENWNALWNTVAVPSLTIGLTAAGKSYAAYFSKMNGFSKRPWTVRAYAEFELVFVGYELEA